MYEASKSNEITVTVKSATLPTDGWSIKIEADGEKTNLQLGVENILSIAAPNGYTGDDYRVEWLVSRRGGAEA